MRGLPSFCLLAMLAFLPQGRALRQKTQKLALISAKTTKIRAVSAKSTKIRAYSVRFHLSKELLLLPRRVFGLRVRSQSLTRHVLGFHRSAMRCLRLFVCSQCSHFCRKAEPCDKKHKNSRRIFGENADAFCSLGVFSGKVRAHFAFMARFRGKCGRILFRRHDFGESALAHGSLGAILGKVCAREGVNGAFWGKVRVHYGDWSKNYKKRSV